MLAFSSFKLTCLSDLVGVQKPFAWGDFPHSKNFVHVSTPKLRCFHHTISFYKQTCKYHKIQHHKTKQKSISEQWLAKYKYEYIKLVNRNKTWNVQWKNLDGCEIILILVLASLELFLCSLPCISAFYFLRVCFRPQIPKVRGGLAILQKKKKSFSVPSVWK